MFQNHYSLKSFLTYLKKKIKRKLKYDKQDIDN